MEMVLERDFGTRVFRSSDDEGGTAQDVGSPARAQETFQNHAGGKRRKSQNLRHEVNSSLISQGNLPKKASEAPVAAIALRNPIRKGTRNPAWKGGEQGDDYRTQGKKKSRTVASRNEGNHPSTNGEKRALRRGEAGERWK